MSPNPASRGFGKEVARARLHNCLSKLGECQLHAVSVVVLGTAARDDEGWITGLKIEIADAARSDLRAPLAVSSASLRMRAMPSRRNRVAAVQSRPEQPQLITAKHDIARLIGMPVAEAGGRVLANEPLVV